MILSSQILGKKQEENKTGCRRLRCGSWALVHRGMHSWIFLFGGDAFLMTKRHLSLASIYLSTICSFFQGWLINMQKPAGGTYQLCIHVLKSSLGLFFGKVGAHSGPFLSSRSVNFHVYGVSCPTAETCLVYGSEHSWVETRQKKVIAMRSNMSDGWDQFRLKRSGWWEMWRPSSAFKRSSSPWLAHEYKYKKLVEASVNEARHPDSSTYFFRDATFAAVER